MICVCLSCCSKRIYWLEHYCNLATFRFRMHGLPFLSCVLKQSRVVQVSKIHKWKLQKVPFCTSLCLFCTFLYLFVPFCTVMYLFVLSCNFLLLCEALCTFFICLYLFLALWTFLYRYVPFCTVMYLFVLLCTFL